VAFLFRYVKAPSALLAGTLARDSRNPSEILCAMNRGMLARSKDGFTACLVLCLDPDGRLTIANAGHLSSYVEGKELDIENGLPLGLAADTRYGESTIRPTRQ
jgi:serine phosphatase RsbU (regulator of sigma subunit)